MFKNEKKSKKIPVSGFCKNLFVNALAQYHVVLSITFDNLSNRKSSLEHLRKAAELGNSLAQNNLGTYYSKGDGVPRDYIEAIRWYKAAAVQGEPWGQANLGWAYYEGKGIEQSFELAAFWYKKAATQNHPESQYNLGLMYLEGLGVEKNYEEAIKCFKKASKLGVIEAIEILEKL